MRLSSRAGWWPRVSDTPQNCEDCGRATIERGAWTEGNRPTGATRRGARGRCTSCYSVAYRAGTFEHEPTWPEATFTQADLSWQSEARCAEIGVDLFFPDRGGDVGGAKRICAPCPVRAACGAYAIHIGAQHGVWGGLSAHQRAALARAARCRMSADLLARIGDTTTWQPGDPVWPRPRSPFSRRPLVALLDDHFYCSDCNNPEDWVSGHYEWSADDPVPCTVRTRRDPRHNREDQP